MCLSGGGNETMHGINCSLEFQFIIAPRTVFGAVALKPISTELQRYSAERADHSATALNGHLQRYSAERALYSATALNGRPTALQR